MGVETTREPPAPEEGPALIGLALRRHRRHAELTIDLAERSLHRFLEGEQGVFTVEVALGTALPRQAKRLAARRA
jgi:hypothetical protein